MAGGPKVLLHTMRQRSFDCYITSAHVTCRLCRSHMHRQFQQQCSLGPLPMADMARVYLLRRPASLVI